MSEKVVAFGDITINEHGLELGDNPACSSGAPLTIGWESQATHTCNLDLYEYMRGEPRHGRKQLAIPVEARGQILLEAGYSLDEIATATLLVEDIKKLRNDSMKSGGWELAKSIVEGTGRLPKGILSGMNNLLGKKPVQRTYQARSA